VAPRFCHRWARSVISKAGRAALILVVEDNDANQLLVGAMLQGRGYDVQFASSASEAVTSIQHERPDLILMDISLPGQDGLALTRQLKADPVNSSIRIVALTAHAMVGDRKLSLDAGCIGHITKPFDTKLLNEQIAGFLLLPSP
jgi:two-component system, cell cycle response regulator DivK